MVKHHVTKTVITNRGETVYVTEMVTVPPKVYMRAHRLKRKVRVVDIAEKMGIERESVYRLERRGLGDDDGYVDVRDMAEYAAAIGEENPTNLLFPPGFSSIDAIIKDEPDETKALAADIVRRLVARDERA